ncbi:hypothetical protein CBOM_03832 [Ceraceosorus bombacis]|uniref:Uncharacterized protein n=1 Tax=Ceraceosorus bombacis TaxID=401625 RepID=A0A0N7LA41_9BASI|nr:hypothetical protein CBOM_03832 [Ceraceosorus bombacis]
MAPKRGAVAADPASQIEFDSGGMMGQMSELAAESAKKRRAAIYAQAKKSSAAYENQLKRELSSLEEALSKTYAAFRTDDINTEGKIKATWQLVQDDVKDLDRNVCQSFESGDALPQIAQDSEKAMLAFDACELDSKRLHPEQTGPTN